jgi:MOSC domain-containing protein YiiM
VERIEVDAGGVLGDKHYAKDALRAVMIASTWAYARAAQHGIALEEGALEENLLVDFDPYSLPLGSRLFVGDEVVLEIAQYGTICKSLTRIDNRLPKLLNSKRGIFTRVVRGGTIAPDDRIRIDIPRTIQGDTDD